MPVLRATHARRSRVGKILSQHVGADQRRAAGTESLGAAGFSCVSFPAIVCVIPIPFKTNRDRSAS
ncbi:hypothetical protein D7S86_25280 [Pararobbsia silviterrae]|uniref:Uncharacterized protein n=1 Tax=Pararobbsia silviterrae TaxID=1792498 RepID=A0A494X7H2_9BURK|nr:hypothetical protein D7S86_25280 [Pararobbsia silviterrae]